MLRSARRRVALPAKAVLGWFLFRSKLYQLMWTQRAVIVAFHRLDDSYPDDPLTCSTSAFERFVQFCARHFDVISLTELLRRVESGAPLPPSLTITFDDGYRDNRTIAAPILERHNLRGCFFVTTDLIGTAHVPAWDSEKNIQTRWMTWDEVRQLRDAGHEVGSHTRTHVDLGTAGTKEAFCQIACGEKRLACETGNSSGLFAYPFGGRGNTSEAIRELVIKSGLRCCLSAYGGTVKAGDDPFRLKRVNISGSPQSPYQFGFDLITGRLEEK